MLIIPAIDLKEGKVVRFVQGKYDKKVYSKDPVKVARHWQSQGAKLIHIVDLDGAMTGKQKNLEIAKQISRAIRIPVELGGGIRKLCAVKELLQAGISRAVVSTKALEDEVFLKSAIKKFGEKIVVSIDEMQGRVFIKGWKYTGRIKTVSLLKKLKSLGLKEIIYTNISRDGTLKGPDILSIRRILKESGMEVIASGGIGNLSDIVKLKRLEKYGLKGIIVGKALYEGRFTLSEALKI